MIFLRLVRPIENTQKFQCISAILKIVEERHLLEVLSILTQAKFLEFTNPNILL